MATSRQKELVKKLEHNICYCIMARGRFGIPATPRTKLPMTISNCFIPIDIIRKRSIPDAAETLNSPMVIAILLSYCWTHTVGLSSTSGKSLSRSLICIIDSGFEVSCILFLQYHLTGNMKTFYPCYIVIYFSTTILCSKGIGSG